MNIRTKILCIKMLPRILLVAASVFLALLSFGSAQADPPDPLADAFAQPPEAARPRTWWHWVSGNVSREGITADLEAMKRIGLGGAQIFTVDQSDVHGPVKFMSPEWRELVRYAFKEADRLHLEISMEGCDGWSESGGPWVTPKESMQKVVWAERQVSGPLFLPLDLPQPETVRGFYRDIATFAFPTPVGSVLKPVKITANDPHFDGDALLHADSAGATLHFDQLEGDQWVQCEYDWPVAIRSVQFTMTGELGTPAWQVQTSEDGDNFSRVAVVSSGGYAVFDPRTVRFVRLLRSRGTAKEYTITRLQFNQTALPQPQARAGLQVSTNANRFIDPPGSREQTVDPASVVNLTGKKDWQVPEGDYTILRLGHTSTGVTTHPSTEAGLECDKLSAVAVRHHLENMFGPVMADSPSMVGHTFRYLLLDSWEALGENWTPDLLAQFTRRRGYDPTPWLPTLTGVLLGSADQTQRFLWDYRHTLGELVAEMHYGTAQQFAHEHGMELMAEAPGIGLPTVADDLLCKKYTDVPMGEFWVNKTRDENIDDPKEAASAAHVYGKPLAAAESFTSEPGTAAWKNDPYSLKALGDQEFCLGINRFIFHRYAHQPWLDRRPGMSMGPWGINFERTNTWWEPGRAWIEYLTRCQALLQRGQFVADFCYFYGEDVPVGVQHHELKPAPPEGYAYDVCNADALLNLMAVQQGRIVLPGGMNYRALVLPDAQRMSLPVLRKIAALVQAGATVYGPKPLHSPSLTGYPASDEELTRLGNEVWGDCDGQNAREHAYGQGKIAQGSPLVSVVQVKPDFSSAQGGLSFIHRQEALAEVYFIANSKPEAVDTTCTFRVTGKVPELWYSDTGKHEVLAFYQDANGQTTLPLHLDPVGSVFVLFRREASDPSTRATAIKRNGENILGKNGGSAVGLPVSEEGQVALTVFKDGDYEVTTGTGQTKHATVSSLPDGQVLTGPWQVTFPPNLGAPATATLESLTSWTVSPDEGVKYFSGTATYQKEFSVPAKDLGAGRRCYLDLGAVRNLAEVTVNGKDCGILWKEPFRAEITDAIHSGTNHLEVEVTNLWPNRLIRDQQLPENQRITWTSVSLYKPTDPLLPSGLLGPVIVVPAEKVTF